MKKTIMITGLMLSGSLIVYGQAMAQQGQQGQVLTQERAQGPGATLTLSTATVRLIKQQLNQRGYDPGNIDGQWNQQAQAALQNFQQAQGLEPTGLINNRTLALLGISPPGYGTAQYGAGYGGGQYGGGNQAQVSSPSGWQGPQYGAQGQYGAAPGFSGGYGPQYGAGPGMQGGQFGPQQYGGIQGQYGALTAPPAGSAWQFGRVPHPLQQGQYGVAPPFGGGYQQPGQMGIQGGAPNMRWQQEWAGPGQYGASPQSGSQGGQQQQGQGANQ